LRNCSSSSKIDNELLRNITTGGKILTGEAIARKLLSNFGKISTRRKKKLKRRKKKLRGYIANTIGSGRMRSTNKSNASGSNYTGNNRCVRLKSRTCDANLHSMWRIRTEMWQHSIRN
jgi:hypothetical protein